MKASSVEGSVVAVCCHGHGEAHSLSVSKYLSFFPREYAEAFKELCNNRTKGTEELCNARSNKSRRGVQDVKEYLYTQCQDGFDLSNVPDHLMMSKLPQVKMHQHKLRIFTKCIPDRIKVIFNDFVKERIGKHPQSISWEPLTKCKVSTFEDMKKALTSERNGS